MNWIAILLVLAKINLQRRLSLHATSLILDLLLHFRYIVFVYFALFIAVFVYFFRTFMFVSDMMYT